MNEPVHALAVHDLCFALMNEDVTEDEVIDRLIDWGRQEGSFARLARLVREAIVDHDRPAEVRAWIAAIAGAPHGFPPDFLAPLMLFNPWTGQKLVRFVGVFE